MSRKLLALLAFIFVSLSPRLPAQDAAPANIRGVVTVMQPTSITIASNKFGEMGYAVGPQTKVVKLDGTSGTLADISAGSSVIVTTGSNSSQAIEVRLVEPKKRN